MSHFDRSRRNASVDTLHERVSAAELSELWEYGRSLSFDETLTLALTFTGEPGSDPRTPAKAGRTKGT
jgi:hypothetical protein